MTAPADSRISNERLVELLTGLDDAAPNEELGGFVGRGDWVSCGEVQEVRAILIGLRERRAQAVAVKPEMEAQQRPEWIWYSETTSGVPLVTFGRWPKHPQQARYKLAEIQPTEHDHSPPSQAADPAIAALADPQIGDPPFDNGARVMENLVLVPLPTPCTTTVIDGVTYVFMDPAVLRFALAAPPPAAGVTEVAIALDYLLSSDISGNEASRRLHSLRRRRAKP